MSPQARAIAAVMAMAFAVSLAILWPPALPVRSFNVRSAPAPDASLPRLPETGSRVPEALPEPPPHPPITAADMPRSDVAGPVVLVPPPSDEGPPLPVVFSFGRRTVPTTKVNASGEEEDLSEEILEGIVLNTLGKPLSITVLELNIPTQQISQAQLFLGRGVQKRFGTRNGLTMQSGDQITLRSPPYRDLTQTIP